MAGDINNIVVIRPGALGDVLVARAAIRFLRDSFPGARLTLLAPGERGRLFLREGWAHRVFDWDSAAFGWLFSEGKSTPDTRLGEALSDCDLLFSFVDARGGRDLFSKRLVEAAPNALRCHSTPDPLDYDADKSIGEKLLLLVARFSNDIGAKNFKPVPDMSVCLKKRLMFPLPAVARRTPGLLVIHPGSGSPVKNWPVENFASLGSRLLKLRSRDGDLVFHHLLITHGEADGDLGERLCRRVEGARVWPVGSLEELAGMLAGALLYIGNDSGVSHLASAVSGMDGTAARVVTVFGASDARTWAPSGALVLNAGKGMDILPPETAFSKIAPLFI